MKAKCVHYYNFFFLTAVHKKKVRAQMPFSLTVGAGCFASSLMTSINSLFFPLFIFRFIYYVQKVHLLLVHHPHKCNGILKITEA